MNYITAPHRKTLQAKLCTFMNQCEGGSCGCTGDDAKKPDEFERAAIDAMEAIDVVALAPYHDSQKRLILEAFEAKIKAWKATLL